MNKIRIALLALALTVIAIPTVAQAAGLGVAGDYNVFVFGDFTATFSEIKGRAAVGGNAEFNGYGVGTGLTSGSTDNVLMVGGDLDFTNGQVYYGDAQVGGSATLTSFGSPNGKVYPNAVIPIDFNNEKTRLINLSANLASMKGTGTVAIGGTTLTLTGSYTTGLEVFNLDSSDLTGITKLSLANVTGGATIVINISGTSIDLSKIQDMEYFESYSEYIIFNFSEATTVSLKDVEGSILTPSAAVSGTWGYMDGTLIADSYEGHTEFHDVPFEGDLPTPIPGAAWLLGTGLLGLVGLRRKFHS